METFKNQISTKSFVRLVLFHRNYTKQDATPYDFLLISSARGGGGDFIN